MVDPTEHKILPNAYYRTKFDWHCCVFVEGKWVDNLHFMNWIVMHILRLTPLRICLLKIIWECYCVGRQKYDSTWGTAGFFLGLEDLIYRMASMPEQGVSSNLQKTWGLLGECNGMRRDVWKVQCIAISFTNAKAWASALVASHFSDTVITIINLYLRTIYLWPTKPGFNSHEGRAVKLIAIAYCV